MLLVTHLLRIRLQHIIGTRKNLHDVTYAP
jgi:hypothetical protein